MRGPELNECHGYWKILWKDSPKYASLDDLTKIRSLVMHKQIAPKLLNYSTDSNNKYPFHSKVTIHIHDDKDTKEIRKYEVFYWNGSSPLQCSSFRIKKCSTGKTNYYQYFEAYSPNIRWFWYDNNDSKYEVYNLGVEVTEQLECSLQANLICNYPRNIHSEDKRYSEYFNNCSLNKLKKAMDKKDGGGISDKEFLFRVTYIDEKRRSNSRYIQMLEQIAVSDYGFPRTIKRINENKYKNKENGEYGNIRTDIEDYCQEDDKRFNLRMQPLHTIKLE